MYSLHAMYKALLESINSPPVASNMASKMVLKPFVGLLVFLVVLLPTIEGKNYHLMENEVENSQFVYSLFGLNAINKGLKGLKGELSKVFPGAKRPNNPPRRVTSPTDVYALTNLTLCYYLGDDILNSHLQFNDQWKFTTNNLNGMFTYINQLTLGTNYLIGLQNYKLKWKGPYGRSDKTNRYPSRLVEDTKATKGCDIVVFLVFNDFTQELETSGHKYSGYAVGGPCESANGSGYTVIVDQGFLGDHWMGPQILAHHLLLMLTSDLYDPKDSRKYCPNEKSLLHQYIKAGEQQIDQCVIDKLNQSNISLRRCLQDS